MKKVAIIVDTSSGCSVEDSKRLGLELVLMPVIVGGTDYLDSIDIDNEKLFSLVAAGNKPMTSQPSVGVLHTKFKEVLMNYETAIYIPLSSKLSSTCSTAQLVAQDYDGKILVADTEQVAVIQMDEAVFAKKLADQGHDAQYIYNEIEKRKNKGFAFIVPRDLTYLRLGGRISAASAAIGNLIKIKPIIKFEKGKLIEFDKIRSLRKAYAVMIEAIKKENLSPSEYNIYLLQNSKADVEEFEEFRRIAQAALPNFPLAVAQIPVNISVHTGPNTVGLACVLKNS